MIFKSFFVYPRFPENLKKLYDMAYNLWCTWNYDAINLFYRIDPELFRTVDHNPVKFLLNLHQQKINELSEDEGFIFEMEKVWENFQDYMKHRGRFKNGDTECCSANFDTVAYFSMEFGLHECIPIYSGGLGILSGDYLKAASDLGMPVVGVGLIYRCGYFTQRININGEQEELYVEFDNHLVPMHEMHCADGSKAYINIKIMNEDLRIKLWQIDIGQTKLILLDTDIAENPADLRDITNELYVADREKRLQQEFVLGLGGVKALELLKIEPKIYHINEGHSVFLAVARLQKLMTENNLTFTEAKALVRASTVFTTHTPVIAGNENFKTELVEKYLEPEIEKLGLTFDEFARQGFIGTNKDIFWLPVLAINFSKYINGVSKLHGEVSRHMWLSLFPERPVIEVPVDHVTNGVHNSWLSEPVSGLLKRYIGPDYVHCDGSEQHWKKLEDMPEEDLWEAHHKNKHNLIAFIRRKLGDDLAARGYTQSKIMKLSRLFNPEYLTIVFARRFARYKRATLILEDKQRLKNILTDSRKPVQLIFAGKAHPADTLGKHMIKEIIDFIKYNHLEDRVIFLENYDINVARHLVWGADVWLNTPVRENEASGTSGMKAAINGVLNLSVLDGWWPEAYNGKNGWAITAGEFYKQSDIMEKAEAEQIYDLIEHEISEMFYDRNEAGVPEKWVGMMKESMFSVCHSFNMNRVVTNYCEKFYLPAKKDYDELCRNDFQQLKQASSKENDLQKYWEAIELTDIATNVDDKDFLTEGDRLEVTCTVNLDKAPAELVSVELFYMLPEDDRFSISSMELRDRKGSLAHYQCSFDIKQCGLQNFNVRIKPADKVLQDLHPEMIKWKE